MIQNPFVFVSNNMGGRIVRSSEFGVQGSEFRVWSSEFRVQSSEFEVQGSGFRGWNSKFVEHSETLNSKL